MPVIERSRTRTAQHARLMVAHRAVVGPALSLALLLMPPAAASADDDASARCRAIRARARMDASLLIGPRLSLSGLRFPGGRDVDLGSTVGDNMQIRIGLTVTPFEMYRGIRVLDAADVDCRREDAAARLDAWLQAAEQAPDLTARRAQRTYLTAHQAEWAAVIGYAQERRDANVITVLEFNYVQSLVTQLERKLEQAKAELPARASASVDARRGQLDALLHDYTETALEHERRTGGDHAAEAWSLRITGGIVPLPIDAVDWFGIVELSYNLGGLFQGSASTELVAARRDELEDQPQGVVQRARSLTARFSAQRAQAQRELHAIEERVAFLARALSALAAADVPSVAHVRDALSLERYAAESERAYVLASIEALSTYIEEVHASGRTQRE